MLQFDVDLCFVWVWNLVSNSEGEALAEGVRMKNVGKDICV